MRRPPIAAALLALAAVGPAAATSAGPLAAAARPQDAGGAVTAPPQSEIDDAIDAGVRRILDLQDLDGSWRHGEERYVSGQTGLCVYTILKGGLPASHPAVQRGLAFLRQNPPRATYAVACCLMAVDAADPADANELIEAWTEVLLEAQGTGFSYPGHHEDLSLTQYGCLGLRVAASRGVEVDDDVWRDLIDFAERNRSNYGGFCYVQGREDTGSMTAAGIAVLQIARDALEAQGRLGSRDATYLDGLIDDSVQWLGEHLNPHKNPAPSQPNGGGAGWHYYYLYGLERVGGLTGLARFAGRDWYAECARVLVDKQRGDGSWGGTHDTCFGVLVLKRATAPRSGGADLAVRTYGDDDPERAVSIRASGDTPLTFWVSSFGTEALETHEWDGERGKGLRVVHVAYELEDGSEVLAEVQGDAGAPARGERFPARISFPLPGEYKVRARVAVRPIDAGPNELEVLESQVLEVRVDGVMAPEARAALDDLGQDRFQGNRLEVEASSSHKGHGPGRVVDGMIATGWLSANGDAEPWIEIDTGRPPKGDRLALTPHRQGPDRPEAWATPKRVRVLLNRKELGEYEIPRAPYGKFYVDLEGTKRVRLLRIEVLERHPGEADAERCGFAAIELLP